MKDLLYDIDSREQALHMRKEIMGEWDMCLQSLPYYYSWTCSHGGLSIHLGFPFLPHSITYATKANVTQMIACIKTSTILIVQVLEHNTVILFILHIFAIIRVENYT